MSKSLISLVTAAASSSALAHPGHVHYESFLSVAVAIVMGIAVLSLIGIRRWRAAKS